MYNRITCKRNTVISVTTQHFSYVLFCMFMFESEIHTSQLAAQSCCAVQM